MKRYKLLNNVLGWVVFVIAAVTYILTLESTASFWDCGEFIASGYKLEAHWSDDRLLQDPSGYGNWFLSRQAQ